jgi:hypothetical protein
VDRRAAGPSLYAVERWPVERSQARDVRGPLFAIYVGLLVLAAGFGVLAAYQWERRADVAKYADLIANHNQMLAERIKDLQSISEGLAGMVAQAYDGDAGELLVRLDEMQERWPDAADTDMFVKLWVGAKERESEQRDVKLSAFETAAGPPASSPDVKQVSSPDVKQVSSPEREIPIDAAARTAASTATLMAPPAQAEPAQPAAGAASVQAPPTQSVPEQPTPEQASPMMSAAVPPSEPRPEVAKVAPDAALRPSDRLQPAARGKPGIVLRAKEETWIQIVDEGDKPLFTKLMKGDDIHAAAPAAATLITGNPTGLDIFVDGTQAPALNEKGPRRREIALDPARLMAGKAEMPRRPRETAAAPQ